MLNLITVCGTGLGWFDLLGLVRVQINYDRHDDGWTFIFGWFGWVQLGLDPDKFS